MNDLTMESGRTKAGRIPTVEMRNHIGDGIYCVETCRNGDVFPAFFADRDSATDFARDETKRSVRQFHDDVAPARRLDEIRGRRDGPEWSVFGFACQVVPEGDDDWELDGPWSCVDYIWAVSEIDWLMMAIKAEDPADEDD